MTLIYYESNAFTPRSYWEEGAFEGINVNKFYNDTLGLENEAPEVIAVANERIRQDTKGIEMGSATPKNIAACTEFIENLEVEVHDRSGATQISILRVLKTLAAVDHMSRRLPRFERGMAVKILQDRLNAMSIEPENEMLREHWTTVDSSETITLDQLLREGGAAYNIQRHPTSKELGGNVLPIVAVLFHKYLEAARTELV